MGGLRYLGQLGIVEVLDVVLAEVQNDSRLPDLTTLGFRIVAVETSWIAASRVGTPDGLSLVDALCFYHAKQTGRMLLSNDNLLRKTCAANQVEVHGTLWVVQELHRQQLCQASDLCVWLEQWVNHLHAFLPRRELEQLRVLLGCTSSV